MRIIHLEASPGWGGQEIRVLREAIGMRALGHEVFLGVMKGGALIEKGRKEGFIVYEIDFRKKSWGKSLPLLVKAIRRHRIDLVNTHSSLDGWLGGIAARLTRCKVVRTRHLSTPIRGWLNGRLLYGWLADAVVTTCASIVPMVLQKAGKQGDFCRSIPTGVDPRSIRIDREESRRFREKVGAGPDDFLVGTACFMRSWKGIGDFLQAAQLLKGEERIKWVLIGGGHLETYQKMAEEMGLKDRVVFTGHLDNPFPALDALDLFALLSTAHEGVSQAILQAAYLGKPLLATPIGGLQEVCLDGVTGLLVPPFSPDRVAAAVGKLAADRPLAKRLGEEGKRWVEAHFTFEKTLDEMKKVYEHVFTF